MEKASWITAIPPPTKGFEDASHVVGTVVDAVQRIMTNDLRRVFVPIAGLHHSMPDAASGFCVFNDVGEGHPYLVKRVQPGTDRLCGY
ncbi:MAG: hypothetical protein R3F37_10075 [Candidatus Competibacteraceae bacterium]